MKEPFTAATRRDFLKWVSATAALAAAGKLARNALAAESAESWKPSSDRRWGMVIDIERCIGCGSCVVACKEENDVPKDPTCFRTWVERYREGKDETRVDSPNGGYNGFPPLPDENLVRAFFVPKLCNACQHSPCEQVCPVGATFLTPDGAVLVDPKYCIGCRYCIQACPYGCRYLHPVTKVADKCNFCYHRIHRGLKPACVENCPTGARIFGDLKDPREPLTVFLRANKVHVLKPHLNTYPKVFYAGSDKEVR